MAAMDSGYPVTFDVAYPESPNRFLILIRWLLVVPHLIVLNVLETLVGLGTLVGFFAILFTKNYPDFIWRFVVGVMRWTQNATAYTLFLDRYPPFSLTEGQYEPVTFTVEKPAAFNRWLPLVKWLLMLPHIAILIVLSAIATFAVVLLALGVLFTGRYPRGLFNYLVGVGRWGARVNAYGLLLVDRYPPFSLR